MEKELDMLERVWGTIREWQSLYASWKDGAFVDIQVCTGPGSHIIQYGAWFWHRFWISCYLLCFIKDGAFEDI